MKYASLAVFLLLVGLAAVTGGQFRPGGWYESLAKPDFTPPSWLFPVAWTALYVMIAIAGWRAWLKEGFGPAVKVWGVSLALNAAWSWIMFGEHRIGLALIDCYAMLASIFAFIVLAWRVDKPASLLFVPYAVWVGFASILNLAIWQMNP